MKKDFAQLIKDMRKDIRPQFQSIISNSQTLTTEQLNQAFAEIEDKSNQAIVEGGYTREEFDSLHKEYFMDFSSENPDEWVVRHDPENAQIITGN